MSYSIMEALFYGRVIPWERRADITDERRAILQKLDSEKRYFSEKLSPEDYKRFEGFEDLVGSDSQHEEIDIYTHGFTLGALLTLEVLEKKEAIINK